MSVPAIVALLPCHSIEDLPTHHTGEAAHSLLSTLTAAWHPALIHKTGSPTNWRRVDEPPEDCHGMALLVPTLCRQRLPTGFAQRVEQQQGRLLLDIQDRSETARQLADWFQVETSATVSSEITADFFALGYAYWQVQIMTRQLRYSSHLDEVQFERVVRQAAQEWSIGNSESCREHLQQAFDLLMQERNRYFPVDPLLIDLTLVADTTLGSSLTAALRRTHPINLLVDGELLDRIRTTNPEAAERIRSRVAAGDLEVIGGTDGELPWSLASVETIYRELQRGRQTHESCAARSPRFFGRRRFGLTTSSLQVATQFGYLGALLSNFDEGEMPHSPNNPVEWRGPDGSSLFAVTAAPVDCERPDAFLKLGLSLGESVDSAHSATLMLTHWPQGAGEWFGDLVRIFRYGNVLGQFVTLDEYHRRTSSPGTTFTFSDGDFRSEYLKRMMLQSQADPISKIVDYWQHNSALQQIANLDLINAFLADRRAGDLKVAEVEDPGLGPSGFERNDDRLRAETSARAVATNSPPGGPNSDSDGFAAKSDRETQAFERRIEAWIQRATEADSSHAGSSLIVLNPLPFPRRVVCDIPGALSGIEHSPSVLSADIDPARGGQALLELPAMGYSVLSASQPKRRRRRRASPHVVDGRMLRNEFFELSIDERTGGIRSFHGYQRRGNLLSQQLALRFSTPSMAPQDATDRQYSISQLESMETIVNSSVMGSIECRGKLLAGDQELARFTQRVTVKRGRRICELEIRIDPLVDAVNDPWRSYYCSRLAWNDEAATLDCGINERRCEMTNSRFESVRYIEVNNGQTRVTLFTCGLPFHRRYDRRKLDSLLIVSGESRRQFRLGIGLDVPYPIRAALDLDCPPLPRVVARRLRLPQAAAWLFRIDCKNILVTAIEPLEDDAFARGARIRLRETEGRGGRATIDCARPLKGASHVDLTGKPIAPLVVDSGGAHFDFDSFEYAQIELHWSPVES